MGVNSRFTKKSSLLNNVKDPYKTNEGEGASAVDAVDTVKAEETPAVEEKSVNTDVTASTETVSEEVEVAIVEKEEMAQLRHEDMQNTFNDIKTQVQQVQIENEIEKNPNISARRMHEKLEQQEQESSRIAADIMAQEEGMSQTLAEHTANGVLAGNVDEISAAYMQTMQAKANNIIPNTQAHSMTASAEQFETYNKQNVDTLTAMLVDLTTNGETDTDAIRQLLSTALQKITVDTQNRAASCVPSKRSECEACPCRNTCQRSLAKYNIVTTSIRISEDVLEAVNIMLKEDVRYTNITKSSLITETFRKIAEPYMELARERIDRRSRNMRNLYSNGNNGDNNSVSNV